MKDDEYTEILELREKISNEKINKPHTKYDKPFLDHHYQVYYQGRNCPFLDGRTDGQSTKNLEEHLFCKLTLFTNGGTQKNSECCVMAALAIFKNGSQIFLKKFFVLSESFFDFLYLYK
jgi:hypothetical protein